MAELEIAAALGGSLLAVRGLGLYAAAVALGFRHGIDWDHIAAITDITSATASLDDPKEGWLIGEPGFSLTDESDHFEHVHHDGPDPGSHVHPMPAVGVVSGQRAHTAVGGESRLPLRDALNQHKPAFLLGTLYALGHGSVVTVLGIIAILAAEVLPDWVDPVMERVVGVTLLFLSVYLFYSIYRFFRGGEDFRIRSRWMLVFAGAANAWHWIRSRIGQTEHKHVAPQQYNAPTAFMIGMIHGVGAETGTQALIIATAVGATSKTIAIVSLLFFVVGLLISNSVVTLASTVGFVSARRRQLLYVFAGLIAAVFSLIVGLFFLLKSADILPELDKYVSWVGGPK